MVLGKRQFTFVVLEILRASLSRMSQQKITTSFSMLLPL
jgi:hypothetical protein